MYQTRENGDEAYSESLARFTSDFRLSVVRFERQLRPLYLSSVLKTLVATCILDVSDSKRKKRLFDLPKTFDYRLFDWKGTPNPAETFVSVTSPQREHCSSHAFPDNAHYSASAVLVLFSRRTVAAMTNNYTTKLGGNAFFSFLLLKVWSIDKLNSATYA